MAPLPVFFNELSCSCGALGRQAIIEGVLKTIDCLRALQKLRNDVDLRFDRKISDLNFGVDHLTLPALFPGANNHFSILRSCLDRAARQSPPTFDSEVCHAQGCGVGLLLAVQDRSFVWSFPLLDCWEAPQIDAVQSQMDSAQISTQNVTICNLSSEAHVLVTWRNNLLFHCNPPAPTSLLLERPRFAVRMFLKDHTPPHVHVYIDSHSVRSVNFLAKIRLDNCDVLERDKRNKPSTRIIRDVQFWIEENRTWLLAVWNLRHQGIEQ